MCSFFCICKSAVCLAAHNTLIALRDYIWSIHRIHTPTMVIGSGTAQALNQATVMGSFFIPEQREQSSQGLA